MFLQPRKTKYNKASKLIQPNSKKKSIHIVESLFNSRFLSVLKKTLPPGADFLKKTKRERLMVNENLDQVIAQESDWKNVIKKSHLSLRIIKDNFAPSLEKFCKEGGDLLFPPVGVTPKERLNFASTKAENFLHGVFLFLVSENEITLTDKFDIKSVNFRKISETMDLEHLFVLLIRICMENVYRSCISSNDLSEVDLMDSTGTGFYLFAKRTNIHYSFNNRFQNYLIVQLLSDLSSNREVRVSGFDFKTGKNQELKDGITTKQFGKVKKLIKRKIHKISNQSWFIETFSACFAFLCVLKETPVVLTTLHYYDKKTGKLNEIFQFDSSLQSILDFSKYLPRIIRPTNQKTNDCLKDSVKASDLGTNSMILNDRIRRTANLIQSKCFIINQEYFSILRDCELIDPKKTSKFPFPTELGFSNLSKKFQEWGYHQEFKLKAKMHKELRIMKGKRQLYLTAVDAAKVFSGYPLYYSTKFDYRLRMYPLQFLFSRTTGYLKRTLKDFSPQKLSLTGLTHLLQAYYSFNKSQREIFDKYLEKNGSLTKNLSKKKLKLFFEKNSLNYAGKQFCYSTMLSEELNRIFRSKGRMSTQIWLEVDQNASAFTFLALLFENKKMAKATGLISDPTSVTPDIYLLIRDQIDSYVKAKYKGDLKNTEVLMDFLCKNEKSRGLHKLAAMCWVFNEGKRSRVRKWLEQFKELNDRRLTDNEYSLLDWIGKEYPLIIDKIFPNLSKQKNLVNQAVKLLIKDSTESEIGVQTLDGGLLGWDFHPQVNIPKSMQNPVTKKQRSVRQNRAPSLSKKKSPKSENWFKKQKAIGDKYRLRKHLSTFLPNLIQSMDGAALRILILTVYDKVKYVMNPLHDCFMLTPNAINALGEAIIELYCGPEFAPNLIDRLFFEPLSKKLSSSSLEELDRIKLEFNELKTPFFVDKATLDPWKLYSYEN